jgi:hypothetical protein
MRARWSIIRLETVQDRRSSLNGVFTRTEPGGRVCCGHGERSSRQVDGGSERRKGVAVFNPEESGPSAHQGQSIGWPRDTIIFLSR